MKKILLIFAFAVGFGIGIGSLAQAAPVPLYKVVNSSKAYTRTSAIRLNAGLNMAYFSTESVTGRVWFIRNGLIELVEFGYRRIGEVE